jgi:hypothetical protein
MFELMLAMQAAGMITDYFGTKNQDEMMKMGMKVQQAGIEANLYQTRLESQDASNQAMIQLRQTMGTQIAMNAARGTSTGAGSAVSLLNESVANFNADERIRKLNLLGKENQLSAQSTMSRLNYSSESSKLWQGFTQRSLNTLSSSASGWTGGSNPFSGAKAGGSAGYGMSWIGG